VPPSIHGLCRCRRRRPASPRSVYVSGSALAAQDTGRVLPGSAVARSFGRALTTTTGAGETAARPPVPRPQEPVARSRRPPTPTRRQDRPAQGVCSRPWCRCTAHARGLRYCRAARGRPDLRISMWRGVGVTSSPRALGRRLHRGGAIHPGPLTIIPAALRAGGRRQPGRQWRISEQPQRLGRHFPMIVDGHEQSRRLMCHDVRDAPGARGHHDGARTPPARIRHVVDVRAVQNMSAASCRGRHRGVGDSSRELHVAQAETPDERLEIGALGAVTNQGQASVRMLRSLKLSFTGVR
jgi:hypothetical protein